MVSSKAIKHLPEWFSNNNNKNQQSFHRQSIYIYIYYVQWALMQNNATSAENCAPFAAASFQSIGTCRRPTTFSIPCAMPPCIIAPYFNFNVFCRTAVCEVLSEWMCDACVCADRNSYNTPAAAVFFFFLLLLDIIALPHSLTLYLSLYAECFDRFCGSLNGNCELSPIQFTCAPLCTQQHSIIPYLYKIIIYSTLVRVFILINCITEKDTKNVIDMKSVHTKLNV